MTSKHHNNKKRLSGKYKEKIVLPKRPTCPEPPITRNEEQKTTQRILRYLWVQKFGHIRFNGGYDNSVFFDWDGIVSKNDRSLDHIPTDILNAL